MLPEGFRKALGEARLPVGVSEVRLARRPLEATAEGALAAALSEQRRRAQPLFTRRRG